MNKIIDQLERIAKKDNSAAYKLGIYYETGNFVKQDFRKAIEYYVIALRITSKYTSRIKIIDRLNNLFDKVIEVADSLKIFDILRVLGHINYEKVRIFIDSPNWDSETEEKVEKALECYKVLFENDEQDTETETNFFCLLTRVIINKENSKISNKVEKALLLLGEKDDKFGYYKDVITKMPNNRIKIISDISEYIGKELEDNLGGIYIEPEKNSYNLSHCLYDIETFRKVKNAAEEFLKDIPMVNSDKSNEFEVFEKICQKIAKLIIYDEEAADKDNKEAKTRKYFTSRNLIGALLENRCICAGYAELLRNLCISRGINCIIVGNDKHAFNQVNLNGHWYYMNITGSRKYIREGGNVEKTLLSYDKLQESSKYCKPGVDQFTYPSPYSYEDKPQRN